MNDPIGAFISHEQVSQQATSAGTLTGLDFAVKDVFDVVGFHTGAGNPDWLRTHPPAFQSASSVACLLDAGARLVGKTHTDELTYSLNGENFHYGTPINVNAPGRIPGGSSSGSAAAVAAGLVDFALGTDTGGSVRLPASNCGVFGIRPTHGIVLNDGVVPLAPSFDTVGWFARQASLLEQVGQVLLPIDSAKKSLTRLLLAMDGFDLMLPAARAAINPAIKAIQDAIVPAQKIVLKGDGLSEWMTSFRILQGVEVWRSHGAWIEENKPAFGPDIGARFQWAAGLDPKLVPAAQVVREQVTQLLDTLLAGDAVLCIPTSPSVALPIDAPAAELEDFRLRALTLLSIAGLAGLPQISIPLVTCDGCPLGISLIGPRHSDHALLSLVSFIC